MQKLVDQTYGLVRMTAPAASAAFLPVPDHFHLCHMLGNLTAVVAPLHEPPDLTEVQVVVYHEINKHSEKQRRQGKAAERAGLGRQGNEKPSPHRLPGAPALLHAPAMHPH